MNAYRKLLGGACMTLAVMGGSITAAQEPAAAPSGAATPAAAAPAAAAAPVAAAAPAAAAPAAGPAPAPVPAAKRTAQMEAGEPRADGAAASSAAASLPGSRGAAKAAPERPQANAADRLDLGSSTVTGNQELPKVMYIVPWKKSDIGDLAGKPMNSLLDEVLAPVDRDVFRREVKYYDAVKADAAPGAKAEPAPQVEK